MSLGNSYYPGYNNNYAYGNNRFASPQQYRSGLRQAANFAQRLSPQRNYGSANTNTAGNAANALGSLFGRTQGNAGGIGGLLTGRGNGLNASTAISAFGGGQNGIRNALAAKTAYDAFTGNGEGLNGLTSTLNPFGNGGRSSLGHVNNVAALEEITPLATSTLHRDWPPLTLEEVSRIPLEI